MYNGWKNYETWNVALWLGNDEALFHAAQNFAQKHRGRISAAAARAFTMDLMPHGTPDFGGDVLRYTKVQWGDIAKAISKFR